VLEKRKLRERDNATTPLPTSGPSRSAQPATRTPVAREPDPFHEFLDTPKNLSSRALAHAQGRVRLRNPEGTVSKWVERKDADSLLDQGWTVAPQPKRRRQTKRR
jgi:hypothetical protein